MTLAVIKEAIPTGTKQVTFESRLLGGWRLIRRLTVTRWFDLYLAAPATCDPDWPADYVIKTLRHDAEPAMLARACLRREVEVGRCVHHPNLATVLAADEDNVPPYIVQPYYEGISLDAMLTGQSKLALSDTLWIGRQIAEALDALHRAGWMHGDIKPSNILVAPNGHATLIDLGFARRLDQRMLIAGEPILQLTLGYAAPELYLEECQVTPAADFYSLGVCLYEALTGQRLFAYQTPDQITRAHLEEIPTELRQLNPLVPVNTARMIMRLLAKDPTARPAARTVIDELVRAEIECFDAVA